MTLYADDGLVIAENERALKKGINLLENWADKYDLTINTEKSKIMRIYQKAVKVKENAKMFGYPMCS